MTREYTFTYLACQRCHQRIKCDQCQEQITQMLMRLKGVQALDMNIVKKTMRIAFDGIDPDDIEEALESAGVFVE